MPCRGSGHNDRLHHPGEGKGWPRVRAARSKRWNAASRERKSVKILYITSTLPFGPGESFITPEIVELLRQGHSLVIVPVSPHGALRPEVASLQAHTVTCSLLSGSTLRRAARGLTRLPRTAASALKVVLVRSRSPRIAAKNCAAFVKGLAVGELAGAMGAEHIHAHWAGCTSTVAMVASIMCGVPWSFTAHRWDILENNLLETKLRSASFGRFVAHDGVEMARAVGAVLPPDKVKVIRVGVQLPESVAVDPKARSIFRVLCPAHLIERKGQQFLIDAFGRVRCKGVSLEIWLAGAGASESALRAQAQYVGGTDCIKFLGQVPHSQILRFYREKEVDCVVLPSLHEGLPNCLIEAMSFGIPVVGTSVAGTPELLRNGAGILVPPRDTGAIADALLLLANDLALRQQIGTSGRRRIEDEYDVHRVSTELTDLWRERTAWKPRTKSLVPP